MAGVIRYALHLLIAIDQLVNALIGGFPDETLSAAAYSGELQGKILPRFFRPFIDLLFMPFESDHCRKAYEAERKRLQLPEGYSQ